jgi:hypothetical protein
MISRPSVLVALVLGLAAVAPACGNGTLDPRPGATGNGGASGTQDGGAACGPVCDIYCAYGNVLDANGCPTCACKPQPGCPTIQITCDAVYCAYGYALDVYGCASCECNAHPCDGTVPETCTKSLPPICDCDPGRACASSDCGGPPPPFQPEACDDGSVPSLECVRNDDRRTCGWRVSPCPAADPE